MKKQPRENASADDEKIAEMCRWLKAHGKVGLGTLQGKFYLLKAEDRPEPS